MVLLVSHTKLQPTIQCAIDDKKVNCLEGIARLPITRFSTCGNGDVFVGHNNRNCTKNIPIHGIHTPLLLQNNSFFHLVPQLITRQHLLDIFHLLLTTINFSKIKAVTTHIIGFSCVCGVCLSCSWFGKQITKYLR